MPGSQSEPKPPPASGGTASVPAWEASASASAAPFGAPGPPRAGSSGAGETARRASVRRAYARSKRA
eukprot:2262157-Lingulodinium_polyedra.AAC.1